MAVVLAESMRQTLGQPIIVENQGAAGGTVAVGRVARAAPDGYTICIGQYGNFVLNGAIYALPYDLLDEKAACRNRTGNPSARTADAGWLAHITEGGSRQVVAHHQRRRNQGQ
ncbi:MAG TPA: tripartite tricarboxylate transporter substrate-binding protein [Xanthobacteraceae bacterium]|jgi:tripartite-type tricarboxylate transporter receptor subunit TctC